MLYEQEPDRRQSLLLPNLVIPPKTILLFLLHCYSVYFPFC